MYVIHLNNGMCSALNATVADDVGPEAVTICEKHGCGGAVRGYDGSPKSVQVGAVGMTGKGSLQYLEFPRD